MKKTLLLLGIGFLIAGNLFANAEFAEMVAYEEEMKVEYAKKAAIEKNINLKISTSEFYSGKIDGKSVSYPGTNLYEADGNPWMIECHGKDKSDAVITLTFNNLEELNPVIVINNGFIKGENYEKYGRPSRIYVSVNETGMGNWFWLQDTPLKQTLNIGGMVPAPGTTDTITVKIAVYKDIVLNYYACIDAVRIEHIFNENYSLNQGVEAKPFIKMQGSYLTENLKSGKVSYTTGNLFFNDGKPWVPEGSNNGIGAILNIKAYNYNEPYSQRLEIYNGFQKDDYYEKNSRLKKFKITYKNKSEVFEIPDSKDVQIVDLSKLLKGCDEPVIDLQLEVIDSYKGSKYSDLCIDAIIAPKYDDSGK